MLLCFPDTVLWLEQAEALPLHLQSGGSGAYMARRLFGCGCSQRLSNGGCVIICMRS